MPSAAWDHCSLDAEILAQIERIDSFYNNEPSTNSDESNDGVSIDDSSSPRAFSRENNLQSALQEAEMTCRISLETLESILVMLNGVGDAYSEVTGRTNALMMNCERLLEDQHTLQQTVEILKTTIKPFTDIEEVACLLGIPFESRGGSSKSPRSSSALSLYSTSAGDAQHSSNLDPRSPEFQDILVRLSKSAVFLHTHYDILDKQHYTIWLERLQHRATSLVGRAMRDLIASAKTACDDIYKQKLYANKGHSSSSGGGGGNGSHSGGSGSDDQPIESSPLYQKFRGLAFRLRELGALLARGGYFANIDGSGVSSALESHSGKAAGRGGARGLKGIAKDHRSSSSSSSAGGTQDVVRPVVSEVRAGYVNVRNELLLLFLKDSWMSGLTTLAPAVAGRSASPFTSAAGVDESKGGAAAGGGGLGAASLCMGIRQSFSTLLRVTQLEQQLFDSLFNLDNDYHGSGRGGGGGGGGDSSEPSTPHTAVTFVQTPTSSAAANAVDHSEVLSIVETVSNATRDFLRPLIIRESSVDELCRVVSTLSEDVRAQMLAMPVPPQLLRALLKGLDGTVNDAKERLSYCAETRIRQDVQLFEPAPVHLAYPDLLQAFAKHAAASGSGGSGTEGGLTPLNSAIVVSSTSAISSSYNALTLPEITSVYETWYPPMRYTLSTLSKLYGTVDMRVFEDFARRAVELCVATLRTGSERVKRSRPAIHGDLFLVRHLLVLREQLVPFEIRLQGTEKHLDFSSTGAAFSQFVKNSQSVWRWDQSNGLLQFARSGLPGMQETQTDAKRDLDATLKAACFSLKQTALKMLLGPLDGFLAKVTAFAGAEIPIGSGAGGAAGAAALQGDLLSGGSGGGGGALLSAEARAALKSQAFVRPERVKEMLESVQALLLQSVPELRGIMKLYIDNQIARSILIKPILQEFDASRRKLECVMASCLDPGQARRDLEALLQTIAYSVGAELSM